MTKVRINANDFIEHLSYMQMVVSGKPSNDILLNVLVRIRSGFALMTASDGEMWVNTKAPILESEEDFTFLVSVSDFAHGLENLKNEVVDITLADGQVVCRYSNGKFRLPSFDSDRFPRPRKNDENDYQITLCAGSFLNAINSVKFAVANDPIRMVMNGVHTCFKSDHIESAATDGQVLAVSKDYSVKDIENGVERSLTIHKKPCLIASTLLAKGNPEENKVKLSVYDNMFDIHGEWFLIQTCLIDGRYPNYESVIPKDNDNTVVINAETLKKAIKRVSLMGNSNTCLIKLTIEDKKMSVTAEDLDFSKMGSEEVYCEYSGEPITIGFNATNLLKCISNTPLNDDEMGRIKILLKDPSRAAVVAPYKDDTECKYVSIVMPMLL